MTLQYTQQLCPAFGTKQPRVFWAVGVSLAPGLEYTEPVEENSRGIGSLSGEGILLESGEGRRHATLSWLVQRAELLPGRPEI